MGERLRQMREALHLTQADVAKVLEVTPVTISKIENGGTSLRPAAVSLICKTYGVSEEWFTNGTGPMLIQAPAEPSMEGLSPNAQASIDKIMERFQTLSEEQKDFTLKYVENLVDSLIKSNESKN